MKKNSILIVSSILLTFLAPTVHAAAGQFSCSSSSAKPNLEPDLSRHLDILYHIMDQADEQQSKGVVSAEQLSMNPDLIRKMDDINLATCRELIETARTNDMKGIVAEVLGIFVSQRSTTSADSIAPQSHFDRIFRTASSASSSSSFPHTTTDAPDRSLSILSFLTNEADKQQKNREIISAKELSERPAVLKEMKVIDRDSFPPLFEIAKERQMKPVVVDVLAAFALQHFDKYSRTIIQQIADFAEDAFTKDAMIKQLALHRSAKRIDTWEGTGFRVSIQDLIDHGLMTFAYSKTGEQLSLSHHRINNLTGLKRIDFSYIRYLDLNHNFLTAFTSHGLPRLTKLESLHLNDNLITHIEQNSFTNFPNLKQITLDNNETTSVEPGSFAGLATLTSLCLRGVPITDPTERMRIEKDVRTTSTTCKVYWEHEDRRPIRTETDYSFLGRE